MKRSHVLLRVDGHSWDGEREKNSVAEAELL
jgi:hypothetical protein